MNLRSFVMVSGVGCAMLWSSLASGVYMNVGFEARFVRVLDGGYGAPGETVSGRFVLDYDAVNDLDGGYTARYMRGVVGGAWSSGGYAWYFAEDPENRYYVCNDSPGPRWLPPSDCFSIFSSAGGDDFFGSPPAYVVLNIFAYLPYGVGLTSIAPPTSLDLDAFTGPASYRLITLIFGSESRPTFSIEYALTRLDFSPVVAAVPEPATVSLLGLGVLALMRRSLRGGPAAA